MAGKLGAFFRLRLGRSSKLEEPQSSNETAAIQLLFELRTEIERLGKERYGKRRSLRVEEDQLIELVDSMERHGFSYVANQIRDYISWNKGEFGLLWVSINIVSCWIHMVENHEGPQSLYKPAAFRPKRKRICDRNGIPIVGSPKSHFNPKYRQPLLK